MHIILSSGAECVPHTSIPMNLGQGSSEGGRGGPGKGRCAQRGKGQADKLK